MSSLDGPSLLPLGAFFRGPDFWFRNPAFTAVYSPSPWLWSFILVASGLSISVLELGVSGLVFLRASELSLACAKAGHERGEGCHSSWFVLAKLPYDPFVCDTMFEGGQGFDIRTVDNLVFLARESIPKLSGLFFGLLCDAI